MQPVAFWSGSFAFDAVKARLMADDFVKPRYPSYMSVVRQIYSEGGVRAFYRGLTPCLLRAAPVNVRRLILDRTDTAGFGALRLGNRDARDERAASPITMFIVYVLAVGEHAGAVAEGPGSGVGNGCARVALTTTGTMPPVSTLIDGCPTAPSSELIGPPCAVMEISVQSADRPAGLSTHRRSDRT